MDKDKPKKSIIIDAHSHLGIAGSNGDFSMKRNANMEEYIKTMSASDITTGIVMPVPSQVTNLNPTQPFFKWSYVNGKFEFKVNDPRIVVDGKIQNPYKIINDSIFRQVSEYNKILVGMHKQPLYFVPLINPLFDTPEHILQMAKTYRPVAFKVHGIATASSVEDFSEKMIGVLKEINIPIIFHTDKSLTNATGLDVAKNKCNPTDIAKWCVKNNLKGYLAHGARLEEEAFKIINDNENLVVGLGPDLICNATALKDIKGASGEDYFLQKLRDSLDISKILFDIDYDWNLNSDGKTLDNGSVARVKKVFLPKEQSNVLYKNAVNYFNLQINCEGEKNDSRKL